MDRKFYDKLVEDCQKYLIDPTYQGEGGIQQEILSLLPTYAIAYAKKLQEYVMDNTRSLSESGKTALMTYFEADIHPEFTSVPSVLDNVAIFLKGVAWTPSKLLYSKHPEKFEEAWIESKRKGFGEKLAGGKRLFGKREGLYRKTAIHKPLLAYQKELTSWALSYRKGIIDMLDEDNAVLSGMEAQIRELDRQIKDLMTRVKALSNVKEEIDHVLDIQDISLEADYE